MGTSYTSAFRAAIAVVAVSAIGLASSAMAAAAPGKVKISSGTSTQTAITLKWVAGKGAKPTKYTVSCAATGQVTKTATVAKANATVGAL